MKYLVDYNELIYSFNPNDVIVLLGIDDLSFNMAKTYFKEEALVVLKRLKDYGFQTILNVERIFFNDEFKYIKNIFDEFCDLIYGITYSDVGIYNFVKGKYPFKTIYHLSQMTTNVEDINIALEENDSVIIGKEVSLKELFFINDHLNKKNKLVGLDGFGRFPIFTSRRKLLSTYFKYRNILDDPKDQDYSLIEETRTEMYPIIENNKDFIVFEKAYYYLFEELNQFSNIDYLYLNKGALDDNVYKGIVDAYIKHDIDSFISLSKDNLSLYKGKLDEETVLLKGGR